MRSLHSLRALGILVLLTTVLTGSALAQGGPATHRMPRPGDAAQAAAPPFSLREEGRGDGSPLREVRPQANLSLWRTETMLSAGNVGQWTAIALHPTTGQPGIVYLDATSDVLFYIWRVCNLTCIWYRETIDAAGGRGASLAYDASGTPHVSYYGSYAFRYAHYDGVSWQTEVVYPADSDAPHTSLALDSQGRPRFAAHVTTEALYYFYHDGTSWHTSVIQGSLNADDGFPSLVMDTQSHPYVSYRAFGDLILAHNNGLTWTYETAPESNASKTSLGIDSYGYLHIAYYDRNTHTLDHALFDGATWTTETVDTVGNWSYFTGTCSLYVKPSGVLFISYYDAGNGVLKYGLKTGLTWDLSVVDSQGDVGAHNALAVDAQNRPFIAYYDTTNADLKFAYRTYGAFLPVVSRND